MKDDPSQEISMGRKYEVWGSTNSDEGRRRLASGFLTEEEAQAARKTLIQKGWVNCVVVQRPPRYGRMAGLQKTGLSE